MNGAEMEAEGVPQEPLAALQQQVEEPLAAAQVPAQDWAQGLGRHSRFPLERLLIHHRCRPLLPCRQMIRRPTRL